MPLHIKTTTYTTLFQPLLEYSSTVWDPHGYTKVLINQSLNEVIHVSREVGCVLEMLKQLHLQQLITRRTNRRLTILSMTSSSPYNAYQGIQTIKHSTLSTTERTAKIFHISLEQ